MLTYQSWQVTSFLIPIKECYFGPQVCLAFYRWRGSWVLWCEFLTLLIYIPLIFWYWMSKTDLCPLKLQPQTYHFVGASKLPYYDFSYKILFFHIVITYSQVMNILWVDSCVGPPRTWLVTHNTDGTTKINDPLDLVVCICLIWSFHARRPHFARAKKYL